MQSLGIIFITVSAIFCDIARCYIGVLVVSDSQLLTYQILAYYL